MKTVLGKLLCLTNLVLICAVCSIHSADTAPPTLTVQPKPSRGYEIYIMDKRIPIKLSCEATGTPDPTYKWLKYDQQGESAVELDPNDERVTISNGNLVLGDPEITGMTGDTAQERVGDSDEGLYQCIAENMFGAALSKKINATIAFLDPFTWVEPQSVSAQVGEKVVLNCDPPMGVPASNIGIYWSWGEPGQPVRNPVEYTDRVLQDTQGNLVFANIKTVDENDYLCNVPNHHIGEIKTSPIFQLTVNTNRPAGNRGPAWVYKPPTSQENLRTKDLQLKCIAEGNPTPAITWKRGGNQEFPMERMVNGPNGALLRIRDLMFGDEGTYICEADNEVGSSITYTTTITIRSAPYWDPNPPGDTTIAPKESVTITCQAGGSPASQITWLINGKPESEVETNDRREIVSGTASGQIIVNDAEESDSAVFQCVAKNKYGEEITSVFLNVLAIPAEIRERPNTLYEVAEGSDVEMRCKPFGAPDPIVTWSFEGNPISHGGRFTIGDGGSTEGMLTIAAATMVDSGMYNCNVSNDFGNEAAPARVTVRMKTTVTEGPANVEVEAKQNIVLKCVVESDEDLELTVTWSHNGVEIDTDVNKNRYKLGSDNSLTVITARDSDSGDYMCEALTTFSSDMATGTVTVLTIPDPPMNVLVTNTDDLQATIEWSSGADGNTPITMYTIEGKTEYDGSNWNEMAEVSAATTSKTVALKAYNVYNFRVKASNKVGISAPSEMSTSHSTPEAPPSMNPKGVEGAGPRPSVMVVSWESMDPVDYSGPNFKYVVQYRVKGQKAWEEEDVTNTRNSYEVNSDKVFQEFEVQVYSENGAGRCEVEADTVTGFSGESEPTAAPTDVNVEVLDSDTIKVTWTDVPEDTVNGQVLGYRAFFSITIAAGSEETKDCPQTPCVIPGLTPYNTYALQLAVRNGKGIGPKSAPIEFEMPEGKPSGVNTLEVKASSDRILATWDKPDNHNGVLQGYVLKHERMLGNVIENTTTIQITGAEETRRVIEKLKPDSKYKITVQAKTGAGLGEEVWAEDSTRPKGPPTPPGKPGFKEIGKTSVNVSYTLPKTGAAADYIKVRYHKKSDDRSKAETTEEIDIFEEEYVHVSGLRPKTKYIFQLIARNNEGEVEGQWDEAETIGTGSQTGAGFKVEAWFVILIVIIILLLLVLLIICVLKSQKGGKYNVSDKEQQLKGDIESAPLKDEGGFEEFQPRDGDLDDNAPLTGGSHPSLNESEAGSSETDSLKEYAEGDTGKFNEEGSFIGQYGDRKTRPPEEGQDGAAYSTFV